MDNRTFSRQEMLALLVPELGTRTDAVQLETQPLRGGLESAGVFRVTAWSGGGATMRQKRSMVVKRLQGNARREARVYQEILGVMRADCSPALLGVCSAAAECRLCLESVRPAVRWPWAQGEASGAVLKSLARLHTLPPLDPTTRAWVEEWDYEAELRSRLQDLLQFAGQSCRRPEFMSLRRSLPVLCRMASALPKVRSQLLQFAPFGRTFIHGDVHPGNVVMRRTLTGTVPVFLDWGRSRIGSPLEDAASWLQSLGYWEPEAKRRHDTLLTGYLAARGTTCRLTRELRDAYWLAAASNLLAGAMLYHLGIASQASTLSSSKRFGALRALGDCLRVLRRADACWSE
jgi:hypothetical protein